MSMLSPSLANSPAVRFTPEEYGYDGDGIPHTFNHAVDAWAWEIWADMIQERKDHGEPVPHIIIPAQEQIDAMSVEEQNKLAAKVRDIATGADRQETTTSKSGRRIVSVNAKDAVIEKPDFLYFPLVPMKVLTLISGRASVSKSTLSIKIAADATRGRLEGDYKGQPVRVGFATLEDEEGLQKARLMAAGADMEYIEFLKVANNPEGKDLDNILIPRDIDVLGEWIRESGAQLLIFDPITSCMEGNTNKRDDVRRALDPLAQMVRDCAIGLIGVLHFGKGAGYVSDKMSGSHAFRDTARSVVLLAKDDKSAECFATLDKSNYTTEQGKSYRYTLQSYELKDDNGKDMSVGVVSGWMETDTTVNEVLNRNMDATPDDGQAERGEVVDWLVPYLEDSGPTPFKTIAADANDEMGYSKRQLRNAREQAKHPWITTRPDPNATGRGRAMLWELSNEPPDDQ